VPVPVCVPVTGTQKAIKAFDPDPRKKLFLRIAPMLAKMAHWPS